MGRVSPRRLSQLPRRHMNCPSCQSNQTKCIDSRESRNNTRRRRRLCISCNFRFTTYESIVEPASDIADPNLGNHSPNPPAKFIELLIPVLEFLEFHYPGILRSIPRPAYSTAEKLILAAAVDRLLIEK